MKGDENRPEKRSSQTFLLAPAGVEGERETQTGTIDAAVYFNGLWRRRFWIAAAALLPPLIILAFALALPDRYEARATLLLQPPQFSSELRPEPYSLETYQTIIRSDLIISELQAKAVETGLIPANMTRQSLKGMLSVDIYANRETERPGARAFMPLLELVVSAYSPESAAGIANLWAEVATQANTGLTSKVTSGTLDLIDRQYSQVFDALVRQEGDLKDQQDHFAKTLLNEENQGLRRILEFKMESEREQNAYKSETERLLADFANQTSEQETAHRSQSERMRLEFLGKWKPDLLKKQISIREEKLSLFEDELLGTQLQLRTQKDLIEKIKEQIQTQPQYLVLSKAVTDEALWDRIGTDSSGGLPKELADLKLRSELLNPNYQTLLEQLIAAQIQHDTLAPKAQYLRTEIENLEAEIDRLKKTVAEKESELFELIQHRETELKILRKNRDTELNALFLRRDLAHQQMVEEAKARLERLGKTLDTELAALTRERDLKLKTLQRGAEELDQTFKVLAEKHGSAQLAKAGLDSDVQIGVLAVTPDEPVNSKHWIAAIMAGAMGLLLSVVAVVVLESFQRLVTAAEPPRRRESGEPPTTSSEGERIDREARPLTGRTLVGQ